MVRELRRERERRGYLVLAHGVWRPLAKCPPHWGRDGTPNTKAHHSLSSVVSQAPPGHPEMAEQQLDTCEMFEVIES